MVPGVVVPGVWGGGRVVRTRWGTRGTGPGVAPLQNPTVSHCGTLYSHCGPLHPHCVPHCSLNDATVASTVPL